MSLAYRSGRPDDVPYVVSCWRKSMLESPDHALLKNALRVEENIIFRGFTNRIVRLLQDCTLRIACDATDDTNIVGFAVYSEKTGIGHYRYVRERFRGHGIASKLIEVPIAVCTHRPNSSPLKMRQTFNPFLLEAS